jgi:hypothetical protein
VLVGAVFAVRHSVAEAALVDALGRPLRTALGAVELVVGAGDGRAVVLVAAVRAVLVAVAAPPGGDAAVVLATELPAVAWREICEMIFCRLSYILVNAPEASF